MVGTTGEWEFGVTVDGSEIGRSPVDMVNFPIIYRVSGGTGFLQQYYWNMKNMNINGGEYD